MEDKEKNVKIRGGHRSYTKKLLKDADDILKEYNERIEVCTWYSEKDGNVR